jgi:hypothetical protein
LFVSAGLAPGILSAESDPLATVMLPVDEPLNSIAAREKYPGRSSVAVNVCAPVAGKKSDVEAPEVKGAVQFAGSLHVLLVAESQVCEKVIDGTAATAAVRTEVRNQRDLLFARMRLPSAFTLHSTRVACPATE